MDYCSCEPSQLWFYFGNIHVRIIKIMNTLLQKGKAKANEHKRSSLVYLSVCFLNTTRHIPHIHELNWSGIEGTVGDSGNVV